MGSGKHVMSRSLVSSVKNRPENPFKQHLETLKPVTTWIMKSSTRSFGNDLTPEQAAIRHVINGVWHIYDVDQCGFLDKEETKQFVQATLGDLGAGEDFDNERFDEIFCTWDKDGSGTLCKDEMEVVITEMLNE